MDPAIQLECVCAAALYAVQLKHTDVTGRGRVARSCGEDRLWPGRVALCGGRIVCVAWASYRNYTSFTFVARSRPASSSHRSVTGDARRVSPIKLHILPAR